ncbi:MAG: sulfite exporter TauE/SafE family protein [Patescibacteria group bacterium]
MDIFNGFLLGLSTGVFCLAYCAPIFLPQLIAEKSKFHGWLVFIKFNLGRLIAYAIFGALFGWLGSEFQLNFLKNFSSWIIISLSVLLILYGLGLSLPKLSWCSWTKKIQLPFISGFLLGINICPPFLLALTVNFQTGGIINGLIFFLMFFLGTTIYLMPLTFFGYLANTKWLRQASRLAAIAVGLIFLFQQIL